MALKKRGYNVDRILNSHREEKLRIQAERVRDRERQEAADEEAKKMRQLQAEAHGEAPSTAPPAYESDASSAPPQGGLIDSATLKDLLERFKSHKEKGKADQQGVEQGVKRKSAGSESPSLGNMPSKLGSGKGLGAIKDYGMSGIPGGFSGSTTSLPEKDGGHSGRDEWLKPGGVRTSIFLFFSSTE